MTKIGIEPIRPEYEPGALPFKLFRLEDLQSFEMAGLEPTTATPKTAALPITPHPV